MSEPDRVIMPGQVWGICAPTPAGPIFVTSYDGPNLRTTTLVALDSAGTPTWRREFDGHPGPPRATATGTVWVSHRGPAGYAFTEVDADGCVLRSVTPEQQPHEHLGAFVVLPDGFCAAWLPADRYHVVPPGGVARAARHTDTGATTWSTPLPLDDLAFPGVVEAGVHTDWQVRPKRPWKPRTIEIGHWQPLLVSADRVLVHVNDGSSGIGTCTILDTDTGQPVATTEPAPYHHKAVAGPGRVRPSRSPTRSPFIEAATSWGRWCGRTRSRSPTRSPFIDAFDDFSVVHAVPGRGLQRDRPSSRLVGFVDVQRQDRRSRSPTRSPFIEAVRASRPHPHRQVAVSNEIALHRGLGGAERHGPADREVAVSNEIALHRGDGTSPGFG